jgi:hypothetical protein
MYIDFSPERWGFKDMMGIPDEYFPGIYPMT